MGTLMKRSGACDRKGMWGREGSIQSEQLWSCGGCAGSFLEEPLSINDMIP